MPQRKRTSSVMSDLSSPISSTSDAASPASLQMKRARATDPTALCAQHAGSLHAQTSATTSQAAIQVRRDCDLMVLEGRFQASGEDLGNFWTQTRMVLESEQRSNMRHFFDIHRARLVQGLASQGPQGAPGKDRAGRPSVERYWMYVPEDSDEILTAGSASRTDYGHASGSESEALFQDADFLRVDRGKKSRASAETQQP